MAGHYPGGHLGLGGAATPDTGEIISNFNRFHLGGDLKDPDGGTVERVNRGVYANNTPFVWNTD